MRGKRTERADIQSMTSNTTSCCMATAGHILFSGIHWEQHNQLCYLQEPGKW